MNLADLKIHERREHSGETPFGCETCQKSFRSKRLLQEHEKTHLTLKPFLCANCGKTFASASGLRQHFKRHETCKLASLPGSFSLVEDLDKDPGTLLVDFLPQPPTNENPQNLPRTTELSVPVQGEVILIDNQTFALPPLQQ